MTDNREIVLSLCDRSGNFLMPWAETGQFRCIAVDIQHAPGASIQGGIEYVGADIRSWLPPRGRYRFVAGWPPCTHLAVSGARWWRGKGLSALAESIELVDRCAQIIDWADADGFIENPVGALSTHWREPDYTFDPCDYGDTYTKKTCLWAFKLFRMPPKNRVDATEGSKMHLMPPSDERANLRSETPMGFARAVFKANYPARQPERGPAHVMRSCDSLWGDKNKD